MTLLGILSDLHLGYQKVTWKKLEDEISDLEMTVRPPSVGGVPFLNLP